MNSESELIRLADRILREILSELNGFSVTNERANDPGYDLLVRAETADKYFRFAVEIKSRITPQIAYSVCAKLARLDALQINTLRGVDLAFAACDEISIKGVMPDGTRNTVRVRVVRLEAFLLIKAFALDERTKDKDAYDIAFVLRNYQPSVESLAEPMRTLTATGLGREGYGILQAKFESLDSIGPVAAARTTQEQGEVFAQAHPQLSGIAQVHTQEINRKLLCDNDLRRLCAVENSLRLCVHRVAYLDQ